MWPSSRLERVAPVGLPDTDFAGTGPFATGCQHRPPRAPVETSTERLPAICFSKHLSEVITTLLGREQDRTNISAIETVLPRQSD